MNACQDNRLDDTHNVSTCALPSELHFSEDDFERLWNRRPDEFHEIMIHGTRVKTPRWQQAYGVDYHYTGQVNRALPILKDLMPVLDWSRSRIHDGLNGILLNWYDGSLGHYIGKHRDSTTNMVPGAPIVTVSLGEERVFRLRPWKGEGYRDFPVADNSMVVIPYDTNLAWTHEVPRFARHRGRRISITLRAFE